MLTLSHIPRPTHRLQEELQSARQHDHLCLVYRDEEEGLFSATAFLKAGLSQGEQCVYVADDHTSEAVRQAMARQDIDVEAATGDGRLAMAGKEESYLRGGTFDPSTTITFFGDAADEAKAGGYQGLRGAAEMTWQLGGDPGSDRLIEYEARINRELFPLHPVVGLCQFSLQRFSAELIREVLFTHPKVIIGGLVCRNFYYRPPDQYVPGSSHEDAEQEVERMLTNMYEFEKTEVELRVSRQALQDERNLLDQRVRERTAALETKTRELKDLNSHMVGREYRIRELEAEVRVLRLRLDQLRAAT